MTWDPIGWPVRKGYTGIGFKQLEGKMMNEDKGIVGLGRYDMVGKVGEPPEHYAQGIEPIKYIRSHGMGFAEGSVIKYITRYQMKGHAKEDLLKARAYLDLLLEDFGGQ